MLWKEILTDIGYPDSGAVDELLSGTDLLGEVPPLVSGIFENSFKSSEMTVQHLKNASNSVKHQQVYSKTLEEVELGWATGPIDPSDLPQCYQSSAEGLD